MRCVWIACPCAWRVGSRAVGLCIRCPSCTVPFLGCRSLRRRPNSCQGRVGSLHQLGAWGGLNPLGALGFPLGSSGVGAVAKLLPIRSTLAGGCQSLGTPGKTSAGFSRKLMLTYRDQSTEHGSCLSLLCLERRNRQGGGTFSQAQSECARFPRAIRCVIRSSRPWAG